MYIITKKTQLIKSIQKGIFRSKIMEENEVKYSIHTLVNIIDHNCTAYGASFKGRLDAVITILNSKSKLPVPVFPEFGIFMFPTTSIKNNDCIFISYYHVHKYKPYGKHASIELTDKTHIIVETSIKQFDLQMKRTSQVIAYFLGILFLRPI